MLVYSENLFHFSFFFLIFYLEEKQYFNSPQNHMLFQI